MRCVTLSFLDKKGISRIESIGPGFFFGGVELMLNTAHLILKFTALLYIISSMASWLMTGRHIRSLLPFMVLALLGNVLVVALRYYITFPLLPMYLGSVALPLCMGAVAILFFPDMGSKDPDIGSKNRDSLLIFRLTLMMATTLTLAALFFPKDFYLPFLKSKSLWAHLFLVFGLLGKSSFLTGAIIALAGSADRSLTSNSSFRWSVWGFAFWTLSMFSGEMWSYLGWGTPVVWDDPAIATTMATWFFYICYLHLHLTGTWSVQARNLYAATALPVVLILNCLHDLGPFRSPF